MSICERIERNTCGILCRWPCHLCQTSDARKILDADHKVGSDQDRRSAQPARTCDVLGIRVPKCTRWWTPRIHSETYCQVRGRMLGHCSTAERKDNDDTFDGKEEHEPARRDDSLWPSSTHIVQSGGWATSVHNQSETWCSWQNACHTNLRHQHWQIWHVPRKRWDIWKEHVNWISTWRYLQRNRMTWTRPWNTSRDILMLTGPVTRQRGRAHLVPCVTLINFSWRVNVEDRGLLPCPVENQKCMHWVHCQLSWFSHKLSRIKLDYHSWYTREQTAAQHAQWQRNKERVARWNTSTRDSYSFKIWYSRNWWRCH